MRWLSRGLVACVLVSAFVADAADGPIQLLPGEKVRAVFGAGGDFRVAGVGLVAGTSVTITAKAPKGSGADPAIGLDDPSGAAVELGTRLHTKPGLSQIVGLPITVSGIWRIRIATPANAGGEIELSVKSRAIPRKAAGSADAGTDATFGVLAGTLLSSLTVTCPSKAGWTPHVELLDPTGARVGEADGVRSSAKLKKLLLATGGTYVVRVTGGDGPFKFKASLVPPRARKALVWKDVESPPTPTGFTPTDAENDTLRTFRISGAGLFAGQQVQFRKDGTTRVTATITDVDGGEAAFATELADAPAGDYVVRIATPSGNTVDAPGTLHVTNRVPFFAAATPPTAPWMPGLPIGVQGFGFDPGMTVSLAASANQAPISMTATRRDHKRVDLALNLPSFFTGPCDVTITDPGRAPQTYPAAFDVVGWRAAPTDLVGYANANAYTDLYPVRAAYDDATGRAVVSLQEGPGDVRFVLFDTATGTLVSNPKIQRVASTGLLWPQVAFDPTSRTWALTWIERTATADTARVRVVDAADLTLVRGDVTFGSARHIYETSVVANPEQSGFVVTWDAASSTGFAEIRAVRIGPSGGLGVAHRVAESAIGWAYHPSLVRSDVGRYVIVFSGLDDEKGLYPAIRRVVIDGDTNVVNTEQECVHNEAWYSTGWAATAAHPTNGSVFVGFSYDGGTTSASWTPGTFLLSGINLNAGPFYAVDEGGGIPNGYVDTAVWNPTRSEFVVTCTVAGVLSPHVIVRRAGTDGRLRAAPLSHQIEGMWSVLWCGSAPDTLGIARLFDGTDDGEHRGLFTMYVNAGRIR